MVFREDAMGDRPGGPLCGHGLSRAGGSALSALVREACDRAAPAWPVAGMIAAPPYFGLRHQDFAQAGMTLVRVAGSALTMPRRYYREQMAAGRMTRGDIHEALAAHGLPPDDDYASQLLADNGVPPVQRVPLVSHILQRLDPGTPWAAFCVERISQFAAAYFDAGQSSWPMPWRNESLYEAWRDFASLDASPRTIGLKGVADMARNLPRRPLDVIAGALQALAISGAHTVDYCHAALADIGGWAAPIHHLRPAPDGARQDIEGLLAIRLAWEWMLFRAARDRGLKAAWQTALSAWPVTTGRVTPGVRGSHVLQTAFELGYRRRIVSDLAACAQRPDRHAGRGRVAIQAVLCMGTRCEVLRRALEALAPPIQTHGFAALCAGPMGPASVHPLQGVPPAVPDAGREVVWARNILRALSLTEGFARLVLFIAGGPAPSPGPHPMPERMDARAMASLLNSRPVRAGLAQEGIAIPADTRFVAVYYDRAQDDITFFPSEACAVTHARDLQDARMALLAAGLRARQEGGEGPVFPAFMKGPARTPIIAREFVGAAAFIAAPRSRTEEVGLSGRAFLHDYEWRKDPDRWALRYIMTVAMMVAHAISVQYYASMVDNRRFGSGNSALHNTVGGSLGVFEGLGGDLRTGLAIQALSDGRHWLHEPMRLHAFIEAPRACIDEVLADHEMVRSLVEHRWLFLFQMDSGTDAIFLRAPDRHWQQVS